MSVPTLALQDATSVSGVGVAGCVATATADDSGRDDFEAEVDAARTPIVRAEIRRPTPDQTVALTNPIFVTP